MLAWWGRSVSGGAEARTAVDGSMEVGATYYRECRYVDDGTIASSQRFVYRPSGPAPAAPVVVVTGPSIETLVQQAYAEVPLVAPQPHTAPPAGEVLVGLPMWMWVDGAVWRQFDASVAVGGVSVSVAARPEQVVWNLGSGATVICKGPGTTWDPAGSDDQRSDCSHTFQFVNPRVRASVTITWSVTWSASTGESGVLPDASRTTGFTLAVGERQAVIHYGN